MVVLEGLPGFVHGHLRLPRWNGSSWRTEYILDAWGAGASHPDVFPAGELHFIVDIGLVGTQPLRLKAPRSNRVSTGSPRK
jgi:hypothetical protein